MYSCHITLYYTGCQEEISGLLRSLSPLQPFTHTVIASPSPRSELAAQADTIFADLRGQDAALVLPVLCRAKKPSAQLIALAEPGAVPADLLSALTDLWSAPVTEAELRFRLLRWQEARKRQGDQWQSEYFLKAVLDNTPNLVWFKSKDGAHELANESFCRTVGKTWEQVRGQQHAYIWGVEGDDPFCAESDRHVMESGGPWISEEWVQTSDGGRVLNTYKSALYDMDGSVMGTVGVALDVTQERTYEQELMRRTNSLESLFTTMDCGIICHTVDGTRVLSVNQAALDILGYQSAEDLTSGGFDFVAPSVLEEDRGTLRARIQGLRRVGESATAAYRVRRRDGTILQIIGNIKLVEEDGRRFYQRFLLDCTARKLREEARQYQINQQFQYQRQLFDVLFTYLSNNTDDVFLLLNADADKLEYASQNLERVLGLTYQEMQISLRKFLQVPDAAGQALQGDTLRAILPGQSLAARETERVNARTGEHKWFHESIYCTNLQGERKLVFYISDRTKERKDQDDLAEALKMAQVANTAKSTFLSSVSHDIRTPMNAIMGFLTLLREEAGDKEQVLEYAQRIESASQHLLGLINNVLDLNKIESGGTTLRLSGMDLAEVVDEINNIIRPQARAKEQSFHINVSGLTHEHLVGDRLRIHQVLSNILSNAVKYTQKGGAITMTVTELPQAVSEYSRIRFVISDNGPGMSADYLKVIFDPFTREQGTLTNQVQGTGLGMTITKNLVDLMDGAISVRSQPGKGSTFTVELELRIQDQNADPQFWTEHQIRRILVVDDEEDVCASVVRPMSRTGVQVDVCTDGIMAVEEICHAKDAGQPYDLILLDWRMPGFSGLEITRMIRNRYSGDVPIMVFTAYDWDEIEEEASQVHITHFLPKPFFLRNFQEAIRKMKDEQKKAAAQPKGPVDGKHVLVVDDMAVNRMILTKILGTLGADCEIAENGQEAVDKFTSAPAGTYDIVLMDIQMPVMDGYAATRAIRASGRPDAQSVAVIAITANAFVDDVREALASGMDAHIAKPIVVNKMIATIQEVLDAKSQQPS